MTKKKEKCKLVKQEECTCPDCIEKIMEEEMMLYSVYFEAIWSHVDAIKEENNPDVISVYIEAMELLNSYIPEYLVGPSTIKQHIKKGYGVFEPIQKKCKKLKLC